jgi:DNA-binding MarR family transcriptional regulator
MKPIAPDPILLEDFLPYRLAVLANTVSKGIARLYADRFGISIAEWRMLAILGAFGPATASDIQGRSAMDKVQVSRAIARLEEAGLVTREIDPADRRRATIEMTAEGERIYGEIVPLARAREAALLEGFSADERERLDRLLTKLQAQAEESQV